MREDWIETEIISVASLYQPKTISSKMLVEDGKYAVYGANGIIGCYHKYNHEEAEFLITCRGATCGNAHITKPYSWINGNAMVVQPFNKQLLSLDYLKFVFTNKGRVQKAISGSAQPQITRTSLSPIRIPLAPLPEQRAIVAKIEELFSELDRGEEDLKKVQEQLKIYRQAVLKKAFEGELTKEWREQQKSLPTADVLLEQIKEERQKHYQLQIENWKKALETWEEKGKKDKKPSKPAKYKLFNSPVIPLKLKLPINWFFDCIGNTCTKTEYGTSSKSNTSGDVPVLRMGNMQDGKIVWEDLKYSSDPDEIKQYLLRDGDVLFNRTNSPELVGKTVQYKGERSAIFAGYLIRLNHIERIISGAYLNYFLNSHPAKVYGAVVKTDGVNQSNINGEKFSNYPIPICSIKEQHKVVREIESRLSVCDSIKASMRECLDKSKALRQSILKKAFEGTLLSEEEIAACKAAQDYEPASVLLERIKAEKKKK